MKLVQDYMHRDITSVGENSTLAEVIRIMKLHRMGAVPVVDQKGHYIGCITARDVLDAAVPDYMKSIYDTSFMANLDQVTYHLRERLNEKAIHFISRKLVSVNPGDTMSYAADLLYRHNCAVLPVIDGKNQVGWITKIDILSISLDPDNEYSDK